jgi:osmotically-inducible protein OsmY
MKNDSQIQADVQNQLKWEAILNASEIGVSVKNGVVTLSGIVDAYPKKIAAEKVAKSVYGVKAVALDIQVGISPAMSKSDTEIAEACVNGLKWDSSVPDEKIKVKVENGSVVLEGMVDWSYQRLAAKNAIVNLAGVKGVSNLIAVKQKPSSIDIKQKIKDSFIRTAGHDADNIRVESIGDKVILRGSVRSLYEKEAAENTAWSAPGVNEVDNKIEIVYQELFESA